MVLKLETPPKFFYVSDAVNKVTHVFL